MSRTILYFMLSFLSLPFCSISNAAIGEFTFSNAGQDFPYSVVQTGDNYTFKFASNPGSNSEKLKAGYHLMQSIYEDTSIKTKYSEHYIKERARCYVFDSHFYTYSLCFLPNDFNKNKKDRFWGFVTQMPNWKWLITRFFLPALLAFGLFFYLGRRTGYN